MSHPDSAQEYENPNERDETSPFSKECWKDNHGDCESDSCECVCHKDFTLTKGI